ncbi:MAG: T9SS type A sorting domain-containing protein [Bacteroidota bacterium]
MMEVNVQWEQQVSNHSPYQDIVSFKDDTERIQTHLMLVEQVLRARGTAHLAPVQAVNRMRHLDELRRYWQAGSFPLNHGHAERTPYFIDAHGTACAVGHLLIEDGQEAFAQHIHDEGNNAYVKEMRYPELPAWADNAGFTVGELAWIQPGYPFTTTFGSLPNGVPDEAVNFMWHDQVNNRLIFAGDFDNFSGTACNGIVAWDGSSFTALGSGVDGIVKAAVIHDGNLTLGGSFSNNGGSNLAMWDGSNWTFTQVYTGKIHALLVDNGELYAGGDLTHSGGALVQHILKKEQGLTWSSVGNGFDAPVHALTIHNGEIYAGGDFHNSGNTQTEYVARWDGTEWQPVHNDLDGYVRVLSSDGADLIAGGQIYNPAGSTTRAYGMARMGMSSWEDMLDRQAFQGLSINNDGWIDQLSWFSGDLYVGGEFETLSFMYYGNDVGKYVDSIMTLAPVVHTDSSIHAFAFWGSKLIIGGDYSTIAGTGGKAYLARQDLLQNVDPGQDSPLLSIYPNPVIDEAVIDLPRGVKGLQVHAYDLNGRHIALNTERQGDHLLLHRGNLPAGTYFVVLQDAKGLVGRVRVEMR